MPGIVGLITKMPRKRAELELIRMAEAILHESFYTTGTWIDESLGVYVAWAVQNNSFSDGMPLRNERDDLALFFAGEEYPEPGNVNRLRERGHTLDADGSSYLVHLCEEDSTFPAGLNGRFHGLMVSKTHGTSTLFNDRYGMHRIYYHESKEAFYFAAEAKAILAVRPELRRVDLRSLGEFVACGCVLQNRSLFEKIYVLPPASAWVFQHRSIKQRGTYFYPREWEDQSPLDPESYFQELKDVFSRNLPRYFNGRERIGMSLTGGLDTRMIMAWQDPPAGSLPCYTFGGMLRECRDVLIARQVARACKQSYEVIPVEKEFLSRFPHYAARAVYLTDGSTSVSHSPDLYVNERAREIAPIRMTGNYGDEVLRGMRVFKPVNPSPGLYSPEVLTHIDMARETYAGLLQVHPLSFAVFRQAPWHHYGLLALEQTQVTLRSPYLDNDFVKTIFRAPASASANNEIRLGLIGAGSPALRQIRTDLGFGGRPGAFLGEAARRFQHFTMKAEYAYDYGMPQWVARIDHVLSGLHLERLFLGRHKFYHFRLWYRDVLSGYVKEMLLDPRTLSRPYLQRSTIEAMVRGHLKGDRNYTPDIHRMLTLELLHRLFLDSSARPTAHLPDHSPGGRHPDTFGTRRPLTL
jgi:asparagine synthase (glutamine-hydrolysing)